MANSSQLARINWEAFNQISDKFRMGKGLMVGEVKTLSPSEVEEINSKLDSARKLAIEIDALMEQARGRFRTQRG